VKSVSFFIDRQSLEFSQAETNNSINLPTFFSNLNYNAKQADLEKFFRGYGPLDKIHLKDGFGFINFQTLQDAEDAVREKNGEMLCDRP
jgi:RNA recognition motif-containing protein